MQKSTSAKRRRTRLTYSQGAAQPKILKNPTGGKTPNCYQSLKKTTRDQGKSKMRTDITRPKHEYCRKENSDLDNMVRVQALVLRAVDFLKGKGFKSTQFKAVSFF